MNKALSLCFSIAFIFSIFLFSCKGKDEVVPAYVKIDSVAVSATGLQGNKIHDISAIKLFVDGTFLGVFEIPATVPVLYAGKHQISIIAMTFINASTSQREIYAPLMIADTTANLVAGKITSFNTARFQYRSSTTFLWTEDFEDGNSSLVSSHNEPRDSSVISTVPFNLHGNFNSNTKALAVTLKGADTAKYLDLISFNTFNGLPIYGADVNLEFDMKTPLNVQVALDMIDGAQHTYVPFLIVYPTDGKWKRFYLNLKPEISAQPSTVSYRIFFTIYNTPGNLDDATTYLDNIRFCY